MYQHQRHRSSENTNFLALARNEQYYLQGGDLFFLVEHQHFRVHRYFFERESSFFRGKLTLPASPGATHTGCSESNAIVLDDVTASDFCKFLWVFYNPKYSLYYASVDDWSVILTLAHRWSFPEVKNLAIREMEKLECPDIDRIVVYHANEVDRNLLIPRYAALCEREDPLTLPEGMRLGMETALMIARAREYVRLNPTMGGVRSPTSANVHGRELFHVVRELFGLPPSESEPASAVQPTSPGDLTPPIPEPSLMAQVSPSSKPALAQKTPKEPTAQPPPPPPPTTTPVTQQQRQNNNKTVAPQKSKSKQEAKPQEPMETETPPLPEKPTRNGPQHPRVKELTKTTNGKPITKTPSSRPDSPVSNGKGEKMSEDVASEDVKSTQDGSTSNGVVSDVASAVNANSKDVRKDEVPGATSPKNGATTNSQVTEVPKSDTLKGVGVEGESKADAEKFFEGDGTGDLGLLNGLSPWGKLFTSKTEKP